MNDVLMALLTNGFFLYLTYGYYKLLWKGYPRRRPYYVAAWVMLFVVLNFSTYLFFTQNGLLEIASMIGITILLTTAVIIEHILERIVLVKKQMQEQLMNQQVIYYTKQYEEIAHTQDEIRRQRHELKNSYIALESMAEQGDIEGIQQFLKKALCRLDDGKTIARTGNFTVDAVINYKLRLAKTLGIKTNFSLNIPTKLQVNDVILCGILGNALDNAIDACRYLSKAKRYIKIKMNVEKRNLFIEVTNAFDGTIKIDEKGNLITRKIQMQQHGFGYQTMKSLVHDNNGTMDQVWDEKEFTLRVLLYHVL
ncbi:MAG: GHKL domain-containing protein [Clostridiales bacterium]|nr:GHKL domain-containing protein [Clostridiales bacterium]